MGKWTVIRGLVPRSWCKNSYNRYRPISAIPVFYVFAMNELSNVPTSRVEQPTIKTLRLIIRPFDLSDSDEVQRICSDKEIAANTRTVPYPYPEGAAESWIAQHPEFWATGRSAVFAVALPEENNVIGAVGLEMNEEDHRAELGYWIDEKYRGQGYATEAAIAIVEFGFSYLGLHRIFAHHLARNPVSGKVMVNVGMRQEGELRGHVRKWGVFEDIVVFGILKTDPRKKPLVRIETAGES